MPSPRQALAAIAIATSLLLLAPALPAQGAATGVCEGGVPSCSIRIEPTFLRGARIRRGPDGTDLGRAQGFGGANLPVLLASSDSAVAHARHFIRSSRTATVLGAVAGGLMVAAAVVDLREREVTDAGLAYVAGASVVGLVAIGFELDAQRALSRAVWWYNADMARR